MYNATFTPKEGYVALLAEGVDRNSSHLEEVEYYDGRPPRGGRG